MSAVNELDAMLSFHMAYRNGMITQESIQRQIDSIQESIACSAYELRSDMNEVDEGLSRNIAQTAQITNDLSQAVIRSDLPTQAAKEFVENLSQNLEDLKIIHEDLSGTVERTAQHLFESKEANINLEHTLKRLEQLNKDRFEHDPCFSFLNEVGRRGCDVIARPPCERSVQ